MQDKYDYIIKEESAYKTIPIEVAENWEWNMWEHINRSILYLNSKFSKGKNDGSRPNKNIILPIRNLQIRAEGFDVKDIGLFIDSPSEYYKSFLIRKFHAKWARASGMDTFIDDLVESYVDFGGALVKKGQGIRPEVVPLLRLAFCDQTDILSGPICEKHSYSPDQLRDMATKGWGSNSKGATHSIEEVITLSLKQEPETKKGKSKTPGRYIEVYELHGTFPRMWLNREIQEDETDTDLVNQLQIVCYYKDDKGDKKGVTLFAGVEKEELYKVCLRDKIYNRALGRGGIEELFEPQVWINYDMIRMKDLLDSASKTIFKTTDKTFANRNKINDMENNEIAVLDDGKDIGQVDTFPRNISLFDKSVAEWEAHAQQVGAANDSIMGKNPVSGTPFALQELVTAESHSLHEHRQGQIATFLDELYRDWLIPEFSREVAKGSKFLSELDLDELQMIADALVTCQANDLIKEKILNGELINPEEVDAYKNQVRESFMRGGNKKFFEIFKDEMKDAPIDVYTNIAGKQKNMKATVDKMANVFRQIFANPAILDDPRAAKLFNQMLEYSGLDQMDFYQPPKRQPVENVVNSPVPV